MGDGLTLGAAGDPGFGLTLVLDAFDGLPEREVPMERDVFVRDTPVLMVRWCPAACLETGGWVRIELSAFALHA